MKKVFFTGHRCKTFYIKDMRSLAKLVRKLILEEAEDFYAGGAIGWDMIFEDLVMLKRNREFPSIRLNLVLPCPPDEQTAGWSKDEKIIYKRMLRRADSVEIVSEHYDKDCMKKRNERLVELGDICLCYYNEKRIRSGTGQTVRLAEKKGMEIINFYVERT